MKTTRWLIFILSLLLLLGSVSAAALDSNIPESASPSDTPDGNPTVPVDFVDLTENELVLKPKGTAALKWTLTPTNPTVKTVTFTSGNEAIATVDNRGKVTAVSVGTCTITVTSDSNPSATDICLVTVEPITLTRLTISSKKITMGLGAQQPLTISTAPAGASKESISYHSDNPMVCSVDSNGNLYAENPGESTITVTSGELSATCTVTVNPTPSFQLALGKTKVLKMTGVTKGVLWSSDNASVASVDGGRVTANSFGLASITAEDSATGKKQIWTVGVLNYVKQLTVPARALTLYCSPGFGTGQEYQVVPTVAPEDATDLGFSYKSSAPDIVSVSSNGLLTAHNPGRARITVMSYNGNRKVPINVTVYPAPDEFSLERHEASLSVGRRMTLKLDVSENSSKKGVVWTSSNPGIVTVNAKGVLTGQAAGTVIIRAEIPGLGLFDEAKVTVVVPIKTMTLSEQSVLLPVYASINLTVKITPEEASNVTIKWESSNENVATVDENGKVTARGSGSARISAVSESGRKVSCTVRVPRPNTEIRNIGRK